MESGALYQTIGRALLIVQAAGAGFTAITRGLAAAPGRTSAGVYTMQVLQPATPSGALVKASITAAAAGGGSITCVPDGTGTNWTITTLVGGAAADVNFCVSIEQVDGT